MLVEIPAFFVIPMPKSRQRKKKNKQLQVVNVPEFITQNYKGKSMKVKNPKWKSGRQNHIKHDPQKDGD